MLIVFQTTFLITSTLDMQMFERFPHFDKDKSANFGSRVAPPVRRPTTTPLGVAPAPPMSRIKLRPISVANPDGG